MGSIQFRLEQLLLGSNLHVICAPGVLVHYLHAEVCRVLVVNRTLQAVRSRHVPN